MVYDCTERKDMITVLIGCRQCGTQKERVVVASRKENEEIKSWIEYMSMRIYTDHRNRHPNCTALLDVKIPITDEKQIGA